MEVYFKDLKEWPDHFLDASQRTEFNPLRPFIKAILDDNNELSKDLITQGSDLNIADNEGRTALMSAAYKSNKEITQILLDAGAKVNQSDNHKHSALFYAAVQNNEEIVQLLIEKGSDINVTDRYGNTPLFTAAANTVKEIVQLLIGKGADVNASNIFGETPLFHAAKNDNSAVLRLLIEKGADVNTSRRDGRTAIMFAAENNNGDVVQLLIEKNADVNASDKAGRTAIRFAAENNNEEVLRLLIEKGADVKAHDAYGQTPLLLLADNLSEEVVRLLIEKGADINASDHNGITPLMLAAEYNTLEVTRLLINGDTDVNKCNKYGLATLSHAGTNVIKDVPRLLTEKGANVNVTDGLGYTPLFCEVGNQNEEVAQLLIEKGADVHATDIYGKTPLFFASLNKNEEISRLLIEKGADVNATSCTGQTPLFLAATNTNEEVARQLIEKGADVNAFHKERQLVTALFVAVESNNAEISRLLIEKGADVNAANKFGKTPLFFAAKNKNEKVARQLIEKGADVNIEDKNGQTPLFYALKPSVVRLLLDNGAHLDVRNNVQETVLMYVIKRLSKEQDIHRYDLSLLFNCFKAIVKARDLYGRTAMLHAVMECKTPQQFQEISSILIDKGAFLNDTDNNGVSVLSYFLERYCFEFELKEKNDISKEIIFFTENGIQKSTVFFSALSYLHVILPNLLSLENHLPYCHHSLNMVEVARKYASHQQLQFIEIFWTLVQKYEIPEALDVLMKLGVNPNSADRHGNTALHYATLLPFLMESHQCVMNFCQTLEKHGVRFNVKNKKNETPLHTCLSKQMWEIVLYDHLKRIMTIVDICEFLLKDVSLIVETTRSGESVYHLIMKVLQIVLSGEFTYSRLQRDRKAIFFEAIIKLLEIFSKTTEKSSDVLRKMDDKQNSPLHLWASLSLSPSQSYNDHVTKAFTFQKLLDTILQYLLSHGVSPNPRNEEDRTPLHECKTWTAIELLINAGADRNALDRKRRTPLLNVAKQAKLKQGGYDFCQFRERFLPDAKKDKEFFEKCVSLGLDIWSSDNEGESTLSIFLESECYEMAKALIDATVANTDSTSVIKQLVDTICKDESTSTTWKGLLTKTLITSSAIPSKINLDDALRHICTNIEKVHQKEQNVKEKLKKSEEESESDENTDTKDSEEHSALKSNVYVDIARQLLFYGADGNSLCDDFPKLRPFLTTAISLDQVEKIIPWTSHSKKHKNKLESVSRKQDVEKICNFYFHKEPIGQGSFGEVYAGICEKDGREVAIKKIKISQVNRPQDEREIKNLTALGDSQQVVTYIFFDDSDKDFVYIMLELMEGHLDDYLAIDPINASEFTKLCQCIAKGLAYLHEYQPTPILHRDLKPENILFKFDTHTQGRVQLKIADFGLSTPLLPSRTTVLDSKAGTRCWTAPEVISSQSHQHSKSSDVFSCGLLLHYILSQQKHPFSPADCTGKTREVIDLQTQGNMLNNQMEGWDDSLSIEAKHLIKGMLHNDNTQRPSAADTLRHPFFWSNEKKMKLLTAVGNQPEIGTRRPACVPLKTLESDLENEQRTIIKYGDWNNAKYTNTSAIYTHMQSGPHSRRNCDTRSVVELVRFVRNSVSHVSESGRPIHMQQQILDGVILKEFPALLMEVYKAVNKHGWNSREEIKKALEDD